MPSFHEWEGDEPRCRLGIGEDGPFGTAELEAVLFSTAELKAVLPDLLVETAGVRVGAEELLHDWSAAVVTLRQALPTSRQLTR